MKETTFYVSAKGSDTNEGFANTPFATAKKAIEKAIEAKKNGDRVTVVFEKGNYFTDGLALTEELSGTEDAPVTFKTEGGEVSLRGGKQIDPKLFRHVSGEAAERLYEEARKHVYVCDLADAGIIKEELAPVSGNGNPPEIFVDGKRRFTARYPNDGFNKFADVIEEFELDESGNKVGGGTVLLDEETAERAKKWQFRSNMEISGYFKYDWAASSSRIQWIKADKGLLKMADLPGYGIEKGAQYCISNVFEELDSPNECYIDYDKGLVYIFVDGDINDCKVEISLITNPVLMLNKICNVSFEGFTFELSRKRAVVLENCENVTVKNCTIRNVSEWGMSGFGENIHVDNCEVTGTGFGGITLTGGDRRTLTSSGIVIENCYVHDWSQIRPTYGAGIEVNGCGCRVAHNELTRCPHLAIYYDGNEHIIEYNYLHEIVRHSHDMGAIYGGRDWASYGTVIRYNFIENIGSENFYPVGIYWDDTLAGQTAYGNIIKNAHGQGMLIGGGRDNKVTNNMIILPRDYVIQFDYRGRDWTDTGWSDVNNPGSLINRLRAYDLTEGPWFEKYPMASKIHVDAERFDDEYHAAHPARAQITENLFVYDGPTDVFRGLYGCLMDPVVFRYGIVMNNAIYKSTDECLKQGTYELNFEATRLLKKFERIPVEKIGRNKE